MKTTLVNSIDNCNAKGEGQNIIKQKKRRNKSRFSSEGRWAQRIKSKGNRKIQKIKKNDKK